MQFKRYFTSYNSYLNIIPRKKVRKRHTVSSSNVSTVLVSRLLHPLYA